MQSLVVTLLLDFGSHLGFHKGQSWVHSNVHLFADDTVVSFDVQGQEDADIIQNDLVIIPKEWKKSWGIEFNSSK